MTIDQNVEPPVREQPREQPEYTNVPLYGKWKYPVSVCRMSPFKKPEDFFSLGSGNGFTYCFGMDPADTESLKKFLQYAFDTQHTPQKLEIRQVSGEWGEAVVTFVLRLDEVLAERYGALYGSTYCFGMDPVSEDKFQALLAYAAKECGLLVKGALFRRNIQDWAMAEVTFAILSKEMVGVFKK